MQLRELGRRDLKRERIHIRAKAYDKAYLMGAKAYDIPLNMEKLVKVYSEEAKLLQINET